MSPSTRWRTFAGLVATAGLAALAAACAPESLVGEGELPPDVSDPDATNTPAGAVAAYNGALIALRRTVGEDWNGYIPMSGLLADELQAAGMFENAPAETAMDRRALPEYSDPQAEIHVTSGFWYEATYKLLQGVRGSAREGVRLLRAYAPAQSPALAAHLEAVEGYADLYLADLFCSGVPLSTVEASGYTLRPGSSTEDVYEAALTLFESAIAAASDSVAILQFATMGKARALLALGRHGEAGAAVASVPDGFEYQLRFNPTVTDPEQQTTQDASYVRALAGSFGLSSGPTMADRQGGNGLDYISSGDPRTAAVVVASDWEGGPVYLPAAFATNGSSPITLAGWREARLIEAEAALQGGDAATWLGKLNHLRQTAPDLGLSDLADPGDPDARVDLTFRERAFWLFLTGHRQGDMRRLIRQYGRDPNTVYPIGVHPRGVSYGADVNIPVPALERALNSRFTGCFDRGA